MDAFLLCKLIRHDFTVAILQRIPDQAIFSTSLPEMFDWKVVDSRFYYLLCTFKISWISANV